MLVDPALIDQALKIVRVALLQCGDADHAAKEAERRMRNLLNFDALADTLARVDSLGCVVAHTVPEADAILAKLIEGCPGIEADDEVTYGFAIAATEQIWDMPSFRDYREVFVRHGIRTLVDIVLQLNAFKFDDACNECLVDRAFASATTASLLLLGYIVRQKDVRGQMVLRKSGKEPPLAMFQ
jgi:hypothetical protein